MTRRINWRSGIEVAATPPRSRTPPRARFFAVHRCLQTRIDRSEGGLRVLSMRAAIFVLWWVTAAAEDCGVPVDRIFRFVGVGVKAVFCLPGSTTRTGILVALGWLPLFGGSSPFGAVCFCSQRFLRQHGLPLAPRCGITVV